MLFGQVLYDARLAADMTQEQLSHESGVDRAYISELENDHKQPSLDVVLRLADAMGVRAWELVKRVEEG